MRDVRVVIADPDALARRTVREALNAARGVAAVAGAGCGREAVELVRYHRPDVLITEATHPDVEADELCRRLALEAPATAVVVLCAVEDPELAVRCLRAGAVGYLTKDTEPERLPTVVRGVAEGEAAISRRLTLRLIESLRDVPDTGWRPVRSRLTSREWEVVDLLGEGASTDAIAEHLVLSPATVYSHVKNVHAKLGVHSRHDGAAPRGGDMRGVRELGRDLPNARQKDPRSMSGRTEKTRTSDQRAGLRGTKGPRPGGSGTAQRRGDAPCAT